MTRSRTHFAIFFPVLLLLGLLLPTGATAQVDGAYNTVAYDSLDPSPQGSGRYSALWGYTAPDGREYALLGGYTGTHIVDITQKPIVEVAFIPGPPSGWREMKTYGEVGYIVSEGGGGLQIVDLSNLPDSATLIRADTTLLRTGHTITQEGDWIYVHGMNVETGFNQGTMIFEVATDPLNPKLVGGYDRDYVHDVMISNDTMYAAMINDGRLDIVYLNEDRTEATYVTEITYPGAGTHSSDLTGDGRYILTTDEIGSTAKTMKVWDRSDVDDIIKVGEWTPEPDAIIHNIRRLGDLAYIAWYTAGVRIADISDPLNPVEVGFYDFYEGEEQIYQGCWEVYPYFPSGKIIASSTIDGLHVFTFNGSTTGSAIVTIVDSATGEALPGVTLELPELGRTEVSDANGEIILAAAAGETTYETALLNYRRSEGTLELLAGGAELEIRLAPLAMRKVTVLIDGLDKTGAEVRFTAPVAYDLTGRPEEGKSPEGPVDLLLPADSSYALMIGAWGYLVEEVAIPSGPDSTAVTVTLVPGYYDNADLDLGWSLGDPADNNIGGEWERGVPVGVEVFFNNTRALLEPAEDFTPGPGGKAFMTDIAPARDISPGLADVDSGSVTLTSPRFDLTAYVEFPLSPSIEVALWYTNDAVPFFPADDKLYVRLSDDGGATWVDALTLTSGLSDWTTFSIPITTFVDLTDNMLFRIVAADSMEQGWVEAGMDDFRVQINYDLGLRDADRPLASATLQLLPQPSSGRSDLTLALPDRITGLDIALYNTLGERLVDLYAGDIEAGEHRFSIDGTKLAAGLYHLILRERAGATRRIPLIIAR